MDLIVCILHITIECGLNRASQKLQQRWQSTERKYPKIDEQHKYSVHKSIYFDLFELTNTMATFLLTDRMMRKRKKTIP